MKGRSLFLAAVAALSIGLFAAPTLAFDQVNLQAATNAEESPSEIGLLIRQLEAHVTAHGATIEDINIRWERDNATAGASDARLTSPGCTASATVTLSTGTEAKLAANAPDCTQAVLMVQDAIS